MSSFFYLLLFIFSKVFYLFSVLFSVQYFFMKHLLLLVFNIISSMLGIGNKQYYLLNKIFMATKSTPASWGQSQVESFLKSAIIICFVSLLFVVMFILNFLSPEGTFTTIIMSYLELYLLISVGVYSVLILGCILFLLSYVYSKNSKGSFVNEEAMNYMVFLTWVLLVLLVVFWLLGGFWF